MSLHPSKIVNQLVAQQRGSNAPQLLLIAARQLEPDSALARETYLEALAAAIFAGRLGSGGSPADIAEAVGQACAPLQTSRPIDLLLDGLVIRFTKGYEDAVEPLRQALGAFQSAAVAGQPMRWLWLACRLARDLWDDETWHELTSLQLDQAREAGG